PVILIHSQMAEGERKKSFQAIESGAARIVICVDMLGEGYDLPELKIAALHDAHKGLGITLQFIGRFIRTGKNIGPATVVANTSDTRTNAALEELYSQDADWNVLLQDLTEGAVGRQLRRMEFLDGFSDKTGDIALQNVYPKLSTAVYKVPLRTWNPGRLVDAIPTENLFFSSVNPAENLAI